MCHVTWGAEFVQYGLSIRRSPQRYTGLIRVWDVSHGSRWTPLLGQGIAAADVFWGSIEFEDGSERIDYPQSLRLTFESGARVYLSAYEVRGDDFRMGCMDHVTVFFDRAVAGEFGAWPSSHPHRVA